MTNTEHFEAELMELLKKHKVKLCVCCFPVGEDLRIIGGGDVDRIGELQKLYAVIKPALDAELARRVKEREGK